MMRIGAAAGAVLLLILIIRLVRSPVTTVRPRKETAESEITEPETVETDTAAKVAMAEGAAGENGWNVDTYGWWWKNPDDTVFVNGWKTIDGQQYYFRDTGYMATGWYNTGGIKDSFFDEAGILDPSRQQKLVALTYDDGPSEKTGELLDILERHNAKATFFVVGTQADYYNDRLKRAVELGMEIGNHTYDHNGWLNAMTASEINDTLGKNDELIENYVGFAPALMRPTGGGISSTLIENVGKPMIQWDVDSLDWESLDADQTYERITQLVKDGSIVLMHDLFKPATDAADRYLTWLEEADYKMVTVSQLAEAYGYELEPGGQYYAFYPEGCELNKTSAEGIASGGTAAWD